MAVALIDPNKKPEELFKRNKILNLTDLIHLEQCKLGYKLSHNLLLKSLAENMTTDHKQFSIVKNHQYSTRSKKTPNLPQVASAKYRSSFLYNSIKAYGDLNYPLRKSKNLYIFVKACKKRYLSA